MTSNQQDNYNTIYHNLRDGEYEQTDENLVGLFESLANRIILDLRPSSVLDAGCGKGYLVKSLRAHGAEAWGVDISETAIQNALPESRPYCQVGSIADPFPNPRYDLIICIDTIEHFSPNEAKKVVGNLCLHSDDILLSCIPIDFGNSTHPNAQPPEYWAGLFSSFGFVHDINFDASFIAPWAIRFRKTQLPIGDLLPIYEQKIWLLTQENDLRSNQGVEQLIELTNNEHKIQYWKQVNAQTQTKLNDILNSNSWRLMTRVQHFRERTIPIGSRREKAMRSIFRASWTIRREGLLRFISLALKKLSGDIHLALIKQQQKRKLRASTAPKIGQVCEIESVGNRPKIEPHTTNVDIIICVHNALDDVQSCLTSLHEHTTQPYHLILVDDGSDEATAQYLHEFANSHQATLLRSEKATGYTYAANRGMRVSSAEFVVLLNSDTILTPEWLDRFVACLQSDQKLGMVGPLSNTASWQSVPKIEDSGDWASNPLPEGISPSLMAQLIAASSARLYMEMPLLNGFCLMIRRKLLDEVGLFDEDNFGQGYGEEDDLVLRARKLGWKMALADDVYIYHAQSKSYSSDQRHALSDRAGKILRDKHGESLITQGIRFCQHDLVLEGIRARAQVAYDRDQDLQKGKPYFGKRLLYIIPINSPGGGTNVIRSESLAMQQMGVKSAFFNLETNRQGFEKAYPDLSQSTIYGEIEDIQLASHNYDAVIATFNTTVTWLKPLEVKQSHPVLGYYVQGFEPWIYAQGSYGYKTALDSYTLIKDMVLFTKTEWTRKQVRESTGRESVVIGASVDINLYRPRPRGSPLWPDGPLRIAAMIRPESPYREPLKTMQLLYETSRKYKGEVEILLFGTTYENPAFQQLPHDFPWKLYELLKPEQVANLLSQVDIFVDYSSQQAMGLTAMEAMACGCAVIVPQHGGASSYAIHEQNSLIVDTSSFDNVHVALQRLIDDENLRTRLQRNAIHDICAYYPEQSALNILTTLFKG